MTLLVLVKLIDLVYNDLQVSKIAFLGEGTDAEEARAAGVDIVGGLELVEEIANSKRRV